MIVGLFKIYFNIKGGNMIIILSISSLIISILTLVTTIQIFRMLVTHVKIEENKDEFEKILDI